MPRSDTVRVAHLKLVGLQWGFSSRDGELAVGQKDRTDHLDLPNLRVRQSCVGEKPCRR